MEYYEDIRILGKNRLEPHGLSIPYSDINGALAGIRGKSEYPHSTGPKKTQPVAITVLSTIIAFTFTINPTCKLSLLHCSQSSSPNALLQPSSQRD